ncbi:MAG: glycoside hydrolase family 43 protein [Verrucomicrobiae bacterium]|nr:glycoside hydrolase family 43 protein [Verrucomicrobiae bacterium]
MKIHRLAFCALILSAATAWLRAEPAPVAFDWFEYSGTNAMEIDAGMGEYVNPIRAGFYPDPSICRVGDDYYSVNSTFAYFPGIPIFHSRELVNWDQVGHAIDRPEQLRYDRLGVSSAIYAPTIRYHDGIFYIICTMVGGEGNFIVTATNVAGPWANPIKLGFDGIDPSIYFDDDGKAWVVNNGGPAGAPLYDGHRAIWIQAYDPATRQMTGPRKVLVNGGVDISKKPVWIEGPHIYKKDGWYYLCCAEGGTGPQHSQVVFRGQKVEGPYKPWDRNPILSQRGLSANAHGAVTCTGHADFVIGPDNNWWAVFLGVRPYRGRYSPMGRETFMLPVKWTDDGWPVILPKGERVPLMVKSPKSDVRQEIPGEPLNGNFTWRDEFKETALSPLWIMLRAPKQTWWKLEAGKLKITPLNEQLSGRGNPSFLARRVQHANFTTATALAIPGGPDVSAGLAVFQGEQYNYFAGVRRATNGVDIFIERNKGNSGQEVVKCVHLPDAKNIKFCVTANGAMCAFEYAADNCAWKILAANLDATMLTTDIAGGFVGATVGPFARADGSGNQ